MSIHAITADTAEETIMRGREHRQRLWDTIKTGTLCERGVAVTEYTVILAGMGLVVIGALIFLGGATGGGFADVAIVTPIQRADYGIEPHECKLNGWMELEREGGGGFINQGDCMQYSNTGM